MNTRSSITITKLKEEKQPKSTGIISSNLIKKVIITTNLQREQELKMKENYLKHLKSIDISKYSYPNETKPPTDYTYAKTSSYLSECLSQDEKWEIPNLRRRSRLPLNSQLNKSSTAISARNHLSLYKKFKSYFKQNDKSSELNDSGYESLASASSSSLISQSLNETQLCTQATRTNRKKYSILFLLILCTIPLIAFGLTSTELFSNVNNDYIMPICKYVNRTRLFLVDQFNKYFPLVLDESSKLGTACAESLNSLSNLFISFLNALSSYFLLIMSSFKTFFAAKLNENNNDIEYRIQTNSYLTNEQTDKIINEMKLMKDLILTEVKRNLDSYKQDKNLIDMNEMRAELDRKFNLTFSLIASQLADQERTIESSRSACESELKHMKYILNEIESKYSVALDQLEEQLRKQKLELDKQNENYLQQLSSINQQTASFRVTHGASSEYLSFEKIEEFINKTFYLYNADKTGMTDFASESVGGSIMFTRCTESYQDNSRWFTIFDVPITRVSVSPRVVIQGQIQPGNCWAFKGSRGDLFIKLAAKITPKSFSLEHIPKELSLTGNIDSAPQNFTVYGYVNKDDISDDNRILLGNYRYDSNSKYPLQFFTVQYECNDRPIAAVELKIESNAGNKEYTCLYKFRVHGKLFAEEQKNEKDKSN